MSNEVIFVSSVSSVIKKNPTNKYHREIKQLIKSSPKIFQNNSDVITTKGLQDIDILDGTTVENKGKLILTMLSFGYLVS